MPCCLWQWNNGFDIAGDGVVDSCRAATNGRINAQNVTRPSAIVEAKMNRRIRPPSPVGRGRMREVWLLLAENRSVLAAVRGRQKQPSAAAAGGHVAPRHAVYLHNYPRPVAAVAKEDCSPGTDV